MLAINIEDVISVLNTCKPYLIGLAVVLVLAIVAMVACRKMARSKKFLIRGAAARAMVLAIAVSGATRASAETDVKAIIAEDQNMTLEELAKKAIE